MMAVTGTVAALLFSRELVTLFSTDSTVAAIGTRFLSIEAFVFPAYVLLYICISAMQGVKMPVFGLIVGLFRQIAGPSLIFHLLSVVLGMGLAGIWWGIFGVTWSAALLVTIYVHRTLAQLERDLAAL